MLKHAHNRSKRKRPVSARAVAVVGGALAALGCTALSGTAHAAAPAAATTTTVNATHHHHHHRARTYTVKPGDTLIGISRHHRVPGGWPAIAAANKIVSPYIIHPRQVLKLPSWWHHAPTTTAKPAAAAVPPAAATKKTTTAAPAAATTYSNNLDGWIRHSLAIMAQHNIPGSYDGIHRNIIRESSGDPNAINLWDSNAAAGHPSIGLLQVIQPTFDAYHVTGTSMNIYDPVANITAACNYAYHVYGSIDNVNGPY